MRFRRLNTRVRAITLIPPTSNSLIDRKNTEPKTNHPTPKPPVAEPRAPRHAGEEPGRTRTRLSAAGAQCRQSLLPGLRLVLVDVVRVACYRCVVTCCFVAKYWIGRIGLIIHFIV